MRSRFGRLGHWNEFGGNQIGSAGVLSVVSAARSAAVGKRGHVSTPTGGNALGTDFDLMRSVAASIDARNEEIRATLQSFIGRMSGVPASVWGGMAASRFKDVVHRWNAESMKLHHALQSIAETIRHNEVALRDAADNHALHIGAAAGNL